MSKDTGEPAFPQVFTDEKWSETHRSFQRDTYSAGGMTLRDYFAAKAMAGMILLRSYSGTANEMAAEAYQIADAMIKERNK